MRDGLLDEIIHLENRIQAEVAAEETRAAAWSERELATLDAKMARERLEEEAHLERAMTKVGDRLRREAADLEATAAESCRRLESLDDEALRRVLRKHLPCLLPGGDHDHPHGEG